MKQRSKITAAILIGGKSKRFGSDKALFEYQGEPIVLRVRKILKEVFDKEPLFIGRICLPFDVLSYPDLLHNKGPIGGLYTALKLVNTDYVFLSACDMPFMKKDVIEYMVDNLNDTSSIYIPRFDNSYIEPLFAIYKKTLIGKIEKLVNSGDYRMRSLLPGENVQFLSQREIENFDQELLSFVNINTKHDLKKVEEIKSEKS
ncbi:MAG: molybdenum cofactor guanylyltransferase [Fervidobacterium sp.]